MTFNFEKQKTEYVPGVLFTKPNMNNKIFLLTKDYETDETPTFIFKIMKVSQSNINHLKNVNFTPLTKENFNFTADKTKETTFLSTGIFVDTSFARDKTNEVGRIELTEKKADKTFYMPLLQVSRNYRQFGFSKTLIETIKVFSNYHNKDYVSGFMLPMDKLVHKNVLYPAKIFPPLVLKPSHKFTCNEAYDIKSADVLEKIYSKLGFEVKRNKYNTTGRLTLYTDKVDIDEKLCSTPFLNPFKDIKP